MVNLSRRRRTFTLIETVVVLALVGILLLTAASLVSKQSQKAGITDAAAAVNRVLVSQQSYASTRGFYATDVDDLTGVGRDLTVQGATADQVGEVSMAVGPGGRLGLAALGTNGECYAIAAEPLLRGGEVTEVLVVTCSGSSAAIASDT